MIPKRRGKLDIAQLESCVQTYLNLNPQVVERRQHYALMRVLNFIREDLGASSIEELLKMNAKTLTLSMQKYINDAASGKLNDGKPLAVKSIKFNVYLARAFFSFHDIELKKLKFPRKAGRSRIDRIPMLGEIQKLLMKTQSTRMRLAVMFMTLCGLRLSETLSLRREWIDLDRGFLTLPAEATKSGRMREVPIPTELRNELKRYLEKYPSEKGYIFCSEGKPEKKIPKNRFYENYIALLKRLGLDAKTPDGSAYVLHPHVFRKFYRTMLESAGVNKLLVDRWMGHNSGVEKHYYLPTPDIIKREVEKAEQALKIFGHIHQPLTDDKVKALEDALQFYEKLMELIGRKNPRLLRELGLE